MKQEIHYFAKERVLSMSRNLFCTLKLIKPNIVLLEFVEDIKIDLDQVKTLSDDIIETANYEPYHLIIKTTFTPNVFSDKVQEFLKNHQKTNKLKLSQSMITTSFGKSLLIGAYFRMVKQEVPKKVFSSVDDALIWIEKLESMLI